MRNEARPRRRIQKFELPNKVCPRRTMGSWQRYVLLHETYVGDRGRLWDFANGAELLLVSADVLFERAHDSLGVARAHDNARNELALRHIREHVNKMHREFFRRVVKHHQVGKLSD